MDNAAFRSLAANKSEDVQTTATFKKPTALGSRARSAIPMTPRNVPGYNSNREFAKQLAQHTSDGQPPLKKFKSSAAPKGTKLSAGYVDRTQLRRDEDNDSAGADKAERLKNLEEQMKLGQIDLAQFEKLRDQIGVGGDVGSTHLVKGLDWKLLKRVRQGEDINQSAEETTQVVAPEIDVDAELERALEKDVVVDKDVKRDDLTNEQLESNQTLTRDEILRRFREARNRPAVPAAPVLNERFKKVPVPEKPGRKKYIEAINGRRREVLVITNKDGSTKRKTRWIDPEDVTKPEQQPLGMEVPAEIVAKQRAMLEAEAAEDDNDDIFADAGNDYDPLAGLDSEGEGSDNSAGLHAKLDASSKAKTRNYFSTSNDANEHEMGSKNASAQDPTILAALKRAAQIRQREEQAENESGGPGTQPIDKDSGAKSSAFLAKIREHERQDAADFDYGFGESRFGDDDDDDAAPLYEDGEEGDKKKSGRKRGPKKRKGNKDNVQDVMNVLEGRNKKS